MYQSLEASLHDPFWESEGDSEELALIRSFLEKHPGSTLELGCGSGRLMLPLIQEGKNIYGVDNSKDMINLLRKNAQEQGVEVTAELASLSDFKAPSRLESILIPAFTLQLVSREEALACLHRCRKAVSSSGGLYFTVFIPWAEITGELPENTFYKDHQTSLEDGKIAQCMTKHEINRYEQSLVRTHRYSVKDLSGGKEKHESLQKLQWYSKNELELMLDLANWKVTTIISDFNPDETDQKNSQILTLYCYAV